MTETPDIARIAAGLTKGEVHSIMVPNYASEAIPYSKVPPGIRVRLFDKGIFTKAEAEGKWCRLTDEGLAVRQHIIERGMVTHSQQSDRPRT